jgi:NAD(P)-dependent dehydrogenase (short-subunit alcohol dehydrogenase family)
MKVKSKGDKASARPVAIVTGGSRGIGQAIAKELAGLGYDLVVNCRGLAADGKPDDSHALRTKAELEQIGVDCEVVLADIAARSGREKLVENTKRGFGRCDLLVNNAGVAPERRTDVLQTTEDSYDRVTGTNLKGTFFLTQMIANWMIEQKNEFEDRDYRIVNISSISAYTSSTLRAEYCISKAGLSMVTKLFADRLAEYGIGVFEIRPGIIATDMTSAVKEKYDGLIEEGLTPIKRWGRPEDVARAVAAIAEGRLDFSTGQVIDVDGGFHLRRL